MTDTEFSTGIALIADLRPAPWNPRFMPEDQRESLARSLKEFGLVDPAIVRPSDNLIIGGHQRIDVAQEMGYTEFPVVYHECSDNEAKLLNIALNRITGAWEQDKLAALITELMEAGEDVSSTGFAEPELEELLNRLEGEAGPGEFPTPDTSSGLVECPRCSFEFRPGETGA